MLGIGVGLRRGPDPTLFQTRTPSRYPDSRNWVLDWSRVRVYVLAKRAPPKFGFIFGYVRNRVRVAARPRPKPYSKQEPHFVSRDKVHLVRLMSRDRGESG